MFSWMVWVATLLFFGKDFQLNASLIISFLCFLTIRTNNEPPTKQWCQTCIFRSSIVDTKRAVYSSTLTNQRASLDGQSLTILLEKVVLSTRKLQLPKRNMEPQNHLFWKGTYIFQMGFHVSFPRSMGFWIIKRNTVLKVSFLRLVIQIHPNQGTVHQQLLTGSEGKLFFFQPRGSLGFEVTYFWSCNILNGRGILDIMKHKSIPQVVSPFRDWKQTSPGLPGNGCQNFQVTRVDVGYPFQQVIGIVLKIPHA